MATFLDKRFFSKELTIGMPALYIYDLFGLLFLFSAWIGWQELHKLNGAATASVSASAIAFFAALGLYGVRIATWITIFKRNCMPQKAEWLVSLLPMIPMFICFFFSAPLVRAYASSRDYQYCYSYHDRETVLVFAKPGIACPAKPKTDGS